MRDDQAEREFQARQTARYADTSCPECGAPDDWDSIGGNAAEEAAQETQLREEQAAELEAEREREWAERPAPSECEATWGAERAAYTELDKLRARTRPIPGRPGARIDERGIEWYSSAWL